MPITPDSNPIRQAAHDAYHADPTADIHAAVNGPIRTPGNDAGFKFLFKDAQPGSAEWARAHLIGAEDFGPVELLDGRTGEKLARVNRHARKRLG